HSLPTTVFTQSKPVSNTAIRLVSTALPNITLTRPRHAHQVVTTFKSPIRRHITRSPSSRTSNLPPRVNAVQVPVVSVIQGKQGTWGNPQQVLKDKGVIDSGCSRLPDKSQVLLRVPKENNMYNVNLKNIIPSGDFTCLFAYGIDGKQHKAFCKTKPVSSIDQPLFRLHIDLFGPTFVKSLNKKSYCLVITDDYSRFTWVFFLATKDETTPIFTTFLTGLENQLSLKVKVIRSDNGTEFKNSDLNQFCGLKGIKREFSIPSIPQQNGIVKRKNRTLIEAARTMLADSLLPIPFWAEAVNTACYVQNRVLVTKPHNKTPYELLHGKFQGKVDEGFLVGYSVCSKAFRVFNSRTHVIQETLHVNFLENKPNVAGTSPRWLFDIDSLTRTMNYQPVHVGNQTNSGAATKDETTPIFKTFLTGLENQLSLKVKVIISDNGTEFKNSDLNQFCGLKGIKKEFSIPSIPQQNGIVERKNRTLIEAARTMLADSLLPIPFWADSAV
nr:hypothetical protein [Tanacetum cinerariifolium]